jgi:hypothetical protein
VSQIEASLGAWLAIAEHEACKHMDRWSESSLHQLLVPASQFLTYAKQYARAGDLEGAQRQLETAIGLVLFAAAKHFPSPDLGLLGIAHAAKMIRSSRN